MSDYDPYLNLSDETPEYISVDEKIKTQPDATDLFLNDVENSISSAKKEKKDDLNCEMEIIDEPKDVTSNIQKDTEKKFEEKTEETEIPSTKADSDTDMEESLFTPWKSLEEQYDEFLLETLDFFKADLLLDGSRSPDFPLSRMDIENRDFRYRSKLYNEFRILADKEIKKRPSTIPIIPKEVSRKTLEALDNRMLHPEFSLSAQPSVISTSIIPANHLKTPDTVQIVKKLFASTGASSSVLAHLDFRNTPTIPKAVKHPEWELMRVISGHTGWVRCLDVDTSNEWFVSGGNDRLIKVWDLASGTLKLSLTGHINTVRSVLVSDRHPYLFSCGEDQMIKCWDLECNKVIRHYHGHLSGIYCMTLHPALDILATGGRDATVRLWDMRSKLAIHVLSGHTGTVMSLVSQKNEPQIISGSLDKMIRLWDIVAGKTSVVLTHHKKAIRSLAFHPNEYTFSSAGADNTKVWRLPKGNFERNLEHVNAIINASVIRESEDGNSSIVIGGSDQGHLYFWDWKSGRLFQDMESIPQPGSLSSEQAIYALCLDKSETRLLTGECDKTIKVWRQKEPEEEN